MLTAGHLLDGRVRYAQPASGFRSGIEPVLLAAAIPARPGECVLEAGCGAGAGLLCLSARVADMEGLGIERDPALAALAARNSSANGQRRLFFAAGLVEALPTRAVFDHAFANPPYHAESGTPSPDPGRDQAKREGRAGLALWAERLAARLRPGGTLTLIVPAARLPEAMAAITAARCGSLVLLPLWPRAGVAAKLVLLQATRGGRGTARLLAGLTLHRTETGYTEAAEAVLRHGEALAMAAPAP
jgi:tRNA1(Val) A37 N6-methylase TrmN6